MPLPAVTPRTKNALLIGAVVLVVLGAGFDMYRRGGKTAEPAPQTEQAQQDREQQAVSILEAVAKVYALQREPQPTVATVVDVEQLRKQNPFYNRAKNGDVLVVTQERAILFDPVKNQVLDVVPVQIQQAQPPQAPAQAASSSAAKK